MLEARQEGFRSARMQARPAAWRDSLLEIRQLETNTKLACGKSTGYIPQNGQNWYHDADAMHTLCGWLTL